MHLETSSSLDIRTDWHIATTRDVLVAIASGRIDDILAALPYLPDDVEKVVRGRNYLAPDGKIFCVGAGGEWHTVSQEGVRMRAVMPGGNRRNRRAAASPRAKATRFNRSKPARKAGGK